MATAIIDSLRQQYKDKKVLVVGLGLQGGGTGIVKFFTELGAKVTVTDKKSEKQLSSSIEGLNKLSINFHLGGHWLEDFINADVIFKGPSVRWDLPEIAEAQKKGIPVEMEMSFFTAHCPGKIIGITGTRGKSTTTQMIYSLLKKFNYSVYLGGGLPDISTINYLKSLTVNDWVVAELSSWALSGFHRRKISPHIAVFTNFYPDHLNYYKNMDDYLYDKQAIYLYQKPDDYFIFNKKLLTLLGHPSGGLRMTFENDDFPGELKYLKGNHNRENAAAAWLVGKTLGLNATQCVSVISQFKGLPFRQEVVGVKGNVTFINDTTSTTPVAAVRAIESFSDKPVYLIMGGTTKNLPTTDLINCLNITKKIILLKGGFTDEIYASLKQKYSDKITEIYDDLERAIDKAYQLANADRKEVYVLFSPAAPSFAMFNNEFHRGRMFNQYVKQIIHQK